MPPRKSSVGLAISLLQSSSGTNGGVPDRRGRKLRPLPLPNGTAMTAFVVVVFLLVYLGMILGGLPFLKLDRTGVALLGAIALVATGAVTEEEARAAIHLPTLTLLFSFILDSSVEGRGGRYLTVTKRLS
jgi:hypothetical protein